MQRDELGREPGVERGRGPIATTGGHADGPDQEPEHQEEVLHPGVRLGGERGRLQRAVVQRDESRCLRLPSLLHW